MVEVYKNCPLCDGVLTDRKLRLEAHMICSERGSVQLSPAMEIIIRLLLREPEGLSMYQLFDLTSVASLNAIYVQVCLLRKRLNSIGWSIKLLSYGGNYTLKPLEK